MPSSLTPARHARRALVGLLVVLLLGFGLDSLGVFTSPEKAWGDKLQAAVPKLGLDLQGGTQVILQASTTGDKPPTQDQLDQSVAIIRQRAAAGGSPDAEISTSGARNIVVSLPGRPSQATIDSVRQSAKMEFRPVLITDAAARASAGAKGAYTPPPTLANTPTASPTNGSDLAQVTPYLQDLFTNYDCAQAKNNGRADPQKPLVTCSDDNAAKYLLGPVEVPGTNISNATSGLAQTTQGATTNQWVIDLSFNAAGTKQFGDVSQRLVALQGAQNQFGIVLDGKVISAPRVEGASTNGRTQISGDFTQETAKQLADQLKFGALPINFQVQSQQTISATLGSSQLLAGLIAGLIGLLLVFGYALFQYRVLGFVILGSLGVSAVLTYLVLDFLSWRQGYRISLAGVTGVIVSIGVTADSFIVYFERIRDELREGRALDSAVETGWRRARRTILASDAVNLLAATVLYLLAVGDVRGFALTLGLSTVIDVIVVVLFSHPILQLLARRPFFANGHALSGLDPRALGAVYRGRGQFRSPALAGPRLARSAGEAQRRQTIAERKAAQGITEGRP